MPNKGTGNAIFVLQRLVERSVEKQTDVYTCFIDYSKAFDTVRHDSLVELLQPQDGDKSETKFQQLLSARGGTAQRKIFHLANWSQLIHP